MTTLPRDSAHAARPDTYDMIVVHRVFRREFALLPDLIRDVAPGDRSRSRTLAGHYRLVAAVLEHHHTGEDELIWPKLLERVELRADLVHRMEEQHRALHDLLESVEALIGSWEAAADERAGRQLAAVLQQLADAANEHLRDEEREMLPLIEEHLSVEEWHAMAESGQRGHSKSRLLLILGLMLEDAAPEERSKLLQMLPIHARAVWQWYGAPAYRRYLRRVRTA